MLTFGTLASTTSQVLGLKPSSELFFTIMIRMVLSMCPGSIIPAHHQGKNYRALTCRVPSPPFHGLLMTAISKTVTYQE